MSARRWLAALLVAGSAAALSACEALITDPAPPTTEVTLQFQTLIPIGGTATAFSKVSTLHLRFVRADESSRDTVLFVRPLEGRLRAGISLETDERISALGVQAQLAAGPLPLFSGAAIVPIDPGAPTTAQIPLQPIPARVLASQQTLTLAPLETALLSSAVLYATSDSIEGLAGAWVSLDPTVVTVSPDGIALGQNRGTTELVVTFANLSDTVQATVQ
jgi:hypothetical protein